jgi:hypothetical protein
MDKEMREKVEGLFDVLNSLLGNPICNETCAHGGGCSLETGHEGDHKTEASDGRVFCQWPQVVA